MRTVLIILSLILSSSFSFHKVKDAALVQLKNQELYYQYAQGKYSDTIFTFSKSSCVLSGDTLGIKFENIEPQFSKTRLFLLSSKANVMVFSIQDNLNLPNFWACVPWINTYQSINKKVLLPKHYSLNDSIKIEINSTLTYENTEKNAIDTLKVWGWAKLKIEKN